MTKEELEIVRIALNNANRTVAHFLFTESTATLTESLQQSLQSAFDIVDKENESRTMNETDAIAKHVNEE